MRRAICVAVSLVAASVCPSYLTPFLCLTCFPNIVCRGYFYAGGDHACQSAFTSTTSTLLYISPFINNDVWYSTNPSTPSTTTVVVSTGTYNIFGDGIPVWWQSSDLKAFAVGSESVSSSPTTSQPSPTSTQPSLTSTQSLYTPTISPTIIPSNGLSSSAKNGIGVGIPLVVIVIGLVAFSIYSRRHKRVWIKQTELQNTDHMAVHKLPGHGLDSRNEGAIQEMYQDNELHDPHYSLRPQELPGR
jgi:hypothetical protein